LRPEERQTVLACLHEERFQDRSPAAVYATLLDPKRLIEESCKKQNIPPGQLTLHADRGTSMRSKPVALLLADLGVTKTHNRPHVSDDNPSLRANSEPRNIGRSSRTALGASRTVVLSVRVFFSGITKSTVTAA
jgi:transposase InsO family protein